MEQYKAMFEAAAKALAEIDYALGIGADVCHDLEGTLFRIAELKGEAEAQCGTAIARVIDSDDFAAEVSWILNPLPAGTLLYEGPNVELTGAAPTEGETKP